MKEAILIRYGEIALKSKPVRKRFEMKLVSNIKNALGKNAKVRLTYGRIMVDNADKKQISILKNIFGVVSFSNCIVAESKKENILETGLYVAKKITKKTFAVKTNRVGDHSFTSDQINKELGALIVEKFGNKVNLSNPDATIFVDIRDRRAYIYTAVIRGPGGLPVGAAGKLAVLMDSKKSIAAAWTVLKRGCSVVPIFIKKPNASWIKTIEKWSYGSTVKPKIIESNEQKNIEKAISETSVLGLVLSDDISKADSFKHIKKQFSVPVYRPLLCLSEKDVLKSMNN
ncbi:MAG: THUMP domain-containing protein [Nanoarchaeota archaeon]